MEESKVKYVKRTQKDYSMSFKLSVVSEIERGDISKTGAKQKYGIQGDGTIRRWLKKYGTFDWENQTPHNMPKSKDQTIFELEQKVLLLEKQKALLETQAEQANKKAIFFDMMIDIAEKDLNISIRKKSLPESLINSKNKKK